MSGPWETGGSMGGELHSHPAAARNPDGRLEVFHIGEDDRLYTQWQTAVNNGWSGWHPGELVDLDHSLCALSNVDGRLEVFAISLGHNLMHTWQPAPGQGPWKRGDLGGSTLGTTGAHLAELGTRMGWHDHE